FQNVLTRLKAGLAHGLPVLAVALADPAHVLRTESEPRNLDLRQRDRDDVLALPPDQLALGQVLAKCLLDLAADNLIEALDVAVDAMEHHRSLSEKRRRNTTETQRARRKEGGMSANRGSAGGARGALRKCHDGRPFSLRNSVLSVPRWSISV